VNWWPRSLTWPLLVLLVLGAGSTALISSQWDTGARIHPLARSEHQTRMLSVWRLLATAPGSAEPLLDALSLPEAQFSLQPAAAIDPARMDMQETALADALRQRLALPADTPVHIALHQPAPATSTWTLSTEVHLPDGRWLHSTQHIALMHPHWDRVLRFSLPMIALSILLVAFLFSHRIVRPLKTLAHAVTRISRGDPPVPLALEGPRSVREITIAFNDMQERLERFIQGRTRMIAAISHDLRTPLASLRIRAELISDDSLRQDMIRTLDDMGQMAEETLLFARDDATREPAQQVNLGELISEVIALQHSLGRKVDWIRPPSALACHCRPVHLKRALTILLDNAARYGEGWIGVNVQRTGEILQIEIHDNGPGIDQAQLERVFEPFVRLDAARSTETGGVGLGLAIARACICGHGGELRLKNRDQGGLVAIMTLLV